MLEGQMLVIKQNLELNILLYNSKLINLDYIKDAYN